MAKRKKVNRFEKTAILLFAIIGIISELQIRWVFIGLFGLIVVACAYKTYGYLKARKLKANELDLKYIDSLSGQEFEVYMAKVYRNLGYSVQVTQNSRDFGADLIIYKSNQKICVQAKRYNPSYKVGIKAVQEVVGSLNYYHAFQGIVVANTTFTKAAYSLANVSRVQLVDRSKLLEMIENVKNKKNNRIPLLYRLNTR